MNHDKFCPNVDETCCPWMGLPACDCQCLCDFIARVREDERATP